MPCMHQEAWGTRQLTGAKCTRHMAASTAGCPTSADADAAKAAGSNGHAADPWGDGDDDAASQSSSAILANLPDDFDDLRVEASGRQVSTQGGGALCVVFNACLKLSGPVKKLQASSMAARRPGDQ